MTQRTDDPTPVTDLSQRTSLRVEVLDGPLYTRDQVCRVALRVGAICAVVGITVGYWFGRATANPEPPR